MVNKPFILGSNLVTSDLDLCDYETFMRTVAGNTGNSYISYALIREICGRYRNVPQIKSLYAYDFSQMDRDVDVVNNECTHLCLVLQDQIRIHESYGYQLPYRNIIRFLRKVRRPIVVAGLGANSLAGYDPAFDKKLPQDLIRFLRELAGLVHAIGVRGEFTREVLAKIGVRNAVTIGCPSYFEKGPVRQIVKRGFGRLGVSTGVSPNLLANAQVYLQDCQPVEAEIIKALAFGRKRDFSPDVYAALVDGRMHIFSSIEDWQKSLAALDFFVGLRVHGAICALNSGVPAVVMNGDSRAREMCEYLDIPYLPELVNTDKTEEIFAKADYSRMNDAYAVRYAAFREFMRGNGLELVEPQTKEPADRQPTLQLPIGGDARRVYRLMEGGAESLEMTMADRIRPFRYAVKRGYYRLLAQAFPGKRMHFAERMEHYSDERARCRSFIRRKGR